MRKCSTNLNIFTGKSVPEKLHTLTNDKENEDLVQAKLNNSKPPCSRLRDDSDSTYAESDNFSVHNFADEGTFTNFLEQTEGDPEPEKIVNFKSHVKGSICNIYI